MIPSLVRDNQRLLAQCMQLSQGVCAQHYVDTRRSLSGGSLGAHVRHILDHYLCLLRGVDGGVVDYDRRDRNPRVEVEPACAAAVASELRAQLGALPARGDVPLQVRLRSGRCAQTSQGTTGTSLGRELHAVLLHTVHHHAIIAMELRARGAEVPRDLGVAPATLGWRQATA